MISFCTKYSISLYLIDLFHQHVNMLRSLQTKQMNKQTPLNPIPHYLLCLVLPSQSNLLKCLHTFEDAIPLPPFKILFSSYPSTQIALAILFLLYNGYFLVLILLGFYTSNWHSHHSFLVQILLCCYLQSHIPWVSHQVFSIYFAIAISSSSPW